MKLVCSYPLSSLAVPALMLALGAACGGTAAVELAGTGGSAGAGASTSTGGSGAGGAGGAAGAGGAGGVVPPECQVPTSDPAPYEVTFQFNNPTNHVLYLGQSCWLEYTVTACADGYSEPLSLWAWCSVDCSEPPGGGCIQCEPCWEGGLPVDPGQTLESPWPGIKYTFDTNADGCYCHNASDEPAGLHRLIVPVYLSEQAAELGEVAHEIIIDFSLPAPQDTVVVPLAMVQQ